MWTGKIPLNERDRLALVRNVGLHSDGKMNESTLKIASKLENRTHASAHPLLSPSPIPKATQLATRGIRLQRQEEKAPQKASPPQVAWPTGNPPRPLTPLSPLRLPRGAHARRIRRRHHLARALQKSQLRTAMYG